MSSLLNSLLDSVDLSEPEIKKSIEHGKAFKNYQKKHNAYLNSKFDNEKNVEGFEQYFINNSAKSRQVLNNNNISNAEMKEIESLKIEYNSILKKVQALQANNINTITNFVDVYNPNNKYRNKNVRFSGNGAVGYVTNNGEYKLYPSQEILNNNSGKNGCPSGSPILINYSGEGYNKPGTILNTNPHLLVGTPMQKDQSCGNEGNNVFVNSILSGNIQPKYSGCYTDDLSAPTMTFIGNSPPVFSAISNGNFSQPSIANNTYQTISSASQVPGWDFKAVLLNNSSAWGYKQPYPNGNQCASIQNTGSISQTLELSEGDYFLSFFAIGRSIGSNNIDIQLNGKSFNSVQPPTNKWTSYQFQFHVSKKGSNILSFKGTTSKADYSTALQNISVSLSSTLSPAYTFSMCKEAAIKSGNRYFALQNANPQTGKGYCAVTNNSVSATSKGTSKVVSKIIELLSSKTSGKTGSIASFTEQGTISVIQNGTSIFTTTNNDKTPYKYIGCYGDGRSRDAMTNTSNGKFLTLSECETLAINQNYKYFGTQAANKDDKGWCTGSNDLSKATKYGKATNCKNNKNGDPMGGGSSNAVYSIKPSSVYFLILQDDGNMCIYKGTGPNDNQGLIWASNTKGKQQFANPQYAASKGKYGKNYVMSGATLSAGDFVGSNDGSIYLIMQTDGNLVLYTSQSVDNCNKMTDNNMGGGIAANALYDIGISGFPNNFGKIGYVDSDSNLSEYPSSSAAASSGKSTSNIDSITWQNYKKTGKAVTFHNTKLTNATKSQEFDQLSGRLSLLAKQISDKTNKLMNKTSNINEQILINKGVFSNSSSDFNRVTSINKTAELNNVKGIVNDSNIVVLQENYKFLLWSILAVGVVSFSLNILKK